MGIYSSSGRIRAIVANKLKRLGGRLRSFRLGGAFACWLSNPYGSVGSIESESVETICDSSEATEEMVIVSLAIAPDICVELRSA